MIIGIRKTAWNNANDTQRTILRWGLAKLNLGVPAVYKQGNTRWFIFSDWRMTLNDIARIGTLVKGLATFPNYTFPTKDVLDEDGNVVGTVTDKKATKLEVTTYVKDNWVDPKDVPLTEFVDVTVPVRIQVELDVLDEDGDPTGETYLVWRDHPTDTHVIQVEESLGDPATLVLAAQGAGNAIQAAGQLPDAWTPVEEN